MSIGSSRRLAASRRPSCLYRAVDARNPYNLTLSCDVGDTKNGSIGLSALYLSTIIGAAPVPMGRHWMDHR